MSLWYFILPIIFVALLFVIGFLIFLHLKKQKNLTPNGDTALKLKEINNNLSQVGFYYSYFDDVFYSKNDASQRKFGYCKLYDENMPLVGLIVDCEPICFEYENNHWLIEFWKGQYGMACGAGVGIYNTGNDSIKSPGFNDIFYESIFDNENFSIELFLKKNKKSLIHKNVKQNWLVALKLGEFSRPSALSLIIKLTFPNNKMLEAFVSGLKSTGYTSHEFTKHHKSITIHFTKPHTLQPASRTRVHEAIIQQGNESDCKAYERLTSKYNNTLDKLELLMNTSSDLYDKVLKSFYCEERYSGYESLHSILKKLNIMNPEKIDEPFSDSFDI